jgi:ubiquinone/menaquinone biosynthesis C-methylase UbiE
MGTAICGETSEEARGAESWLRTKLRNYFPHPEPHAVAALARTVRMGLTKPSEEPAFANPFAVDDLAIFDDETLRELLARGAAGLSPDELAAALAGVLPELIRRVSDALPASERRRFAARLRHTVAPCEAERARRRLLDALFWELTYWKTPDLYDALAEGERLHPALFPRLAPLLRGKVVLDAGAGSGRATIECLRQGARRVYAVEPSPGLLRLLERKVLATSAADRITPLRGHFAALPLPDDSMDTALSCSAFTAAPEQGGETGLAELRRVTRSGGTIVLIWPRPEDYGWLAAHGFRYVALPVPERMSVRFRSLAVAMRVVRRFYARNAAALSYLVRTRRPEIPYALLGSNPPHDFCWLRTEK